MKATWPRPDFLSHAAPHRPAIAWLWCAAALVVAVLALDDWRVARQELDAQRARLARALQRAPAAELRPRAPASATQASDFDAARAAQAVADRIGHPWDQILANMEIETPAGLQWLAFDHDADESTVRLEGAAGDIATVLRFVDSLGDHAGWSDVVLGRLRAGEARDAMPGLPAWRFELRAAVDARRIALARPTGER
jgi:hypothetical protein